MRYVWTIMLVVALGACNSTYTVADPVTGELMAKCHEETFQAFCQVVQPEHTQVVQGSAVMTSVGQLLQGMGALGMFIK